MHWVALWGDLMAVRMVEHSVVSMVERKVALMVEQRVGMLVMLMVESMASNLVVYLVA